MVPQWWSGTCGRHEQSASTIVGVGRWRGGGHNSWERSEGYKNYALLRVSLLGKFIIRINAEQGLNSWEKQIAVSQNQLEKKEAILKSEELDGVI